MLRHMSNRKAARVAGLFSARAARLPVVRRALYPVANEQHVHRRTQARSYSSAELGALLVLFMKAVNYGLSLGCFSSIFYQIYKTRFTRTTQCKKSRRSQFPTLSSALRKAPQVFHDLTKDDESLRGDILLLAFFDAAEKKLLERKFFIEVYERGSWGALLWFFPLVHRQYSEEGSYQPLFGKILLLPSSCSSDVVAHELTHAMECLSGLSPLPSYPRTATNRLAAAISSDLDALKTKTDPTSRDILFLFESVRSVYRSSRYLAEVRAFFLQEYIKDPATMMLKLPRTYKWIKKYLIWPLMTPEQKQNIALQEKIYSLTQKNGPHDLLKLTLVLAIPYGLKEETVKRLVKYNDLSSFTYSHKDALLFLMKEGLSAEEAIESLGELMLAYSDVCFDRLRAIAKGLLTPEEAKTLSRYQIKAFDYDIRGLTADHFKNASWFDSQIHIDILCHLVESSGLSLKESFERMKNKDADELHEFFYHSSSCSL